MLRRFHFHRFEFKYLVPETLAKRLHDELAIHMKPDLYAMGCADESYLVRSLYFDTQGFDIYQEKLDGIKVRKKLRIRTYESQPASDQIVYLEMKRRNNNVIIKDRIYVAYDSIRSGSFDALYALLDEGKLPPHRRATLEEFLFDIKRLHMRPKVTVVYSRQPLVGRIDKQVRVTFDRNIRVTATTELYASNLGRYALPGFTVMEVKFSGSMPWWLSLLIQSYNLRSEPVSKYCLGIDASGALHPVERLVALPRTA